MVPLPLFLHLHHVLRKVTKRYNVRLSGWILVIALLSYYVLTWLFNPQSFRTSARDLTSSHTVSASPSPLRLQKAAADNILRIVESIRPDTDIIFLNIMGRRPHRLDQDARRLRLRALPSHTFGKSDFVQSCAVGLNQPSILHR